MTISTRKFIIFLIVLLVACIAAAGVIYFTMRGGTEVLVTVNGQTYGTYDLKTDQTVVIAPPDGSWHNTLVICDGAASVTEADCDNQICVMTPALRADTVGIIVCLPHGVVVELKEK